MSQSRKTSRKHPPGKVCRNHSDSFCRNGTQSHRLSHICEFGFSSTSSPVRDIIVSCHDNAWKTQVIRCQLRSGRRYSRRSHDFSATWWTNSQRRRVVESCAVHSFLLMQAPLYTCHVLTQAPLYTCHVLTQAPLYTCHVLTQAPLHLSCVDAGTTLHLSCVDTGTTLHLSCVDTGTTPLVMC